MKIPLNAKELVILSETNQEAKDDRNADVSIAWRNGRIVDIQITKHIDRETVKRTND